ncbi:hypothetical protein GCM10009716_24370 [Streptomyces sodiiphilus]|uniref:DUF305 domain-containing protein n=1 Tax=Streptomyces sodiiphilus TaxID=226217 RepID=A0ABN2P7I6_9ACTN
MRVTRAGDAVTRALDEAGAITLDSALPQEVAERVLPGMCRIALEVAWLPPARHRLREAGLPHLAVEREIGKARKITDLAPMALADPGEVTVAGARMSPGDALAAIVRHHGEDARELIRLCNEATHRIHTPVGDRRDLVRRTERLAKAVANR